MLAKAVGTTAPCRWCPRSGFEGVPEELDVPDEPDREQFPRARREDVPIVALGRSGVQPSGCRIGELQAMVEFRECVRVGLQRIDGIDTDLAVLAHEEVRLLTSDVEEVVVSATPRPRQRDPVDDAGSKTKRIGGQRARCVGEAGS